MYVLVQGQKMAELSGGHMSTPGESYWDTFLETWELEAEYFSGVGSVFKGEFNAVANTAAGVWQVLRHPIDTTKAVGSAIYNWRNTIKVILNDFVQKSQTLEGQGEIGGDILLGILTGGALKSLKESGRLAKVLDKVKDVAKTTANNAAKRLPDLPTAGSRAASRAIASHPEDLFRCWHTGAYSGWPQGNRPIQSGGSNTLAAAGQPTGTSSNQRR